MLAIDAFRGHDYRTLVAEVLTVDAHAFNTFDATAMFNTRAPALWHVVLDLDGLCALGQSVDRAFLTAVEDDVRGSDPLTIVYTSGSTGPPPKGAVHTHAGLLQHQRNLNAIRGLTAQDRLFCSSPFFWIGGFAFGLLATVVAGATLACSTATDAGVTLDLLEAQRPTITDDFAAAVHLAQHPSFGSRDLPTMRRGNLYPIMPAEAHPPDPALRHNMLGYYGHSRAECFDNDGWFHAGGLVRTDGDGFFYFASRAGSMIKTAGANVSPGEVEQGVLRVLQKMRAPVSDLLAVHVVGQPDSQRGQIVAAVIAVAEGFAPADFDEGAVRLTLKSELSAYKIPKLFAICRSGDLPLKSSGKIDLTALHAMLTSSVKSLDGGAQMIARSRRLAICAGS